MTLARTIAALGLLLPTASFALPADLTGLPNLPPQAELTLPSPPELPELPSLPDLPLQAAASLPSLPELPVLPDAAGSGNPHPDVPPVDPITPAGRGLHPLGGVPVGVAFVPEPAGAVLLLFAALALARTRR